MIKISFFLFHYNQPGISISLQISNQMKNKSISAKFEQINVIDSRI